MELYLAHSRSRRMPLMLAFAASLATSESSQAGPLFMSFGAGGISDISVDGQFVTGTTKVGSTNHVFRWSQAAGLQLIGGIGGANPYAAGISSDGSTIVGGGQFAGSSVAARWTASGGWVSLGDLPGSIVQSSGADVSADGQYAVGTGLSFSGREAFRWDSTTGSMMGLGDLPGGSFGSFARGISDDGTAVVGSSFSANTSPSNTEAARWTQGAGWLGLGDLAGGDFHSGAEAVSADGSVVVGWGSDAAGIGAFRWTQATGMQLLPRLHLGTSRAFGVSGDGSVVVGASNIESFIWDAVSGTRSMKSSLEGRGVNLAGWSLTTADAISADGQWVGGYGWYAPNARYEGWLAYVGPVPAPGAAMILGFGIAGLIVVGRRRCRPPVPWRFLPEDC